MKSLLLKDYYNIKHSAGRLLLTIIFLGMGFIPGANFQGYIVAVSILMGMMTITSFALDERSNWMKYALIMPISRKDYVLEKYVLNFLLGIIGAVIGIIVSTLMYVVTKQFDLKWMLICVVMGVLVQTIFGSIYLPLLFKYGSEQARLIMMAAVGIPGVLAIVGYKAIQYFGITMTRQLLIGFGICIVFILVLMLYGSIRMSIKIMEEKEI